MDEPLPNEVSKSVVSETASTSGAVSHIQPVLGFVSSPAYAPVLKRAVMVASEQAGTAAASGGLGPIASALGAVGASVAAGGAVLLAAETIRSASVGERTPIEVADEYYDTHFSDIWGWLKGDYARRDAVAAEKSLQLSRATHDADTIFDESAPAECVQPCAAPGSRQNARPQPRATATQAPAPLTAGEAELRDVCRQVHEKYDKTKEEYADAAGRINELKRLEAANKATREQQKELCWLIAQRISLAKRYVQERQEYVGRGCDQFEWVRLGGRWETSRKWDLSDSVESRTYLETLNGHRDQVKDLLDHIRRAEDDLQRRIDEGRCS